MQLLSQSLFYCGRRHINFAMVTIFKCRVQQLEYIHIAVQQISKTSSSCKTETLSPLNNKCPILLPPTPGNHHSYSLRAGLFQTPHASGIMQCLVRLYWLIFPSIVSSKFIRVMAYHRVFFLLDQTCICHVFLAFHPLIDVSFLPLGHCGQWCNEHQ